MYETFPFVWPLSVGFGAVFGPKKAVLGYKMRSIRRAPPGLAPRPGAPPVGLCSELGLGKGTI